MVGFEIAGPFGAGIGYTGCELAEHVVALPSLYAGVTQALDSKCGWLRKAGAIGAVAANFWIDFTPLVDYALEYPLYRASNALTDCKE